MVDKKQRIVITGIGPISSVGIGREAFWDGILRKKTNIQLEECRLDGELWDKFFYHKVNDFDINKFGIDKDKLQDIRDWKEGEEVTDLNYLIAAIKLALHDSRLEYHQDNNGIGLVLAHENISLMPFAYNISDTAYALLINKKEMKLGKRNFLKNSIKVFLKVAMIFRLLLICSMSRVCLISMIILCLSIMPAPPDCMRWKQPARL
jgi:3-oxoacyl-(acyl-carrier-protein) synthase